MRKTSVYRCPICRKPYKTLSGWASHMNMDHPEDRPEGYSDTRYFYYTMTGRTSGSCVVCKKATTWNEETGKYNRFCENPKCKEEYREMFKARMVKKYGKVSLLDDPEHQKKMLKNRKISGVYKFKDGGEVDYVGSYELDFLKMLDRFIGLKSSDIMGPSPHTYHYKYEGADHFYIPDFYIPNWNLEVEIKDNQTTHPKFLAVDKVKERLKDEVLKSIKTLNYIKINDKEYDGFFKFLLTLKEGIREEDANMSDERKYDYAQEATIADFKANNGVKPTIAVEVTDASAPSVLDSVSGEYHDGTEPMNVKEFLEVQTPDPNSDKISDFSKRRDAMLDKIQHFGSVTSIFRKKKAAEMLAEIKNYNLDIDLDKYPLFKKYIELSPDFGNDGKIGKIAQSKTMADRNQYPHNPEMESDNGEVATEAQLQSIKDIDNDFVDERDLYPVYVILNHVEKGFAIVVKNWTQYKYSHAMMSFSSELDPHYSFGTRNDGKIGFTINSPKDQFYIENKDNMYMSVFVTFVNKKNLNKMKERVKFFNDNQDKMTYDLIGIFHIMNGKIHHSDTAYFCSGFVANILQIGDKANAKDYALYKPEDLYRFPKSYKIWEGKNFQEIPKGLIVEKTRVARKKYARRYKTK